ncbi:MAG: DUF4855 domain-containing protein, partial [Chthonomonadales bacterium]|nr:DUF4855 domain-containing protein [Chthonomonadales bacterium]
MLQAAIRLAVVAALASSPALAAWADLPTPEQVGFHHCALIYERKTRSKADLLPYVSHVASGRPRAWLFHAFLFLHFTARSGVRTDDGPTTRSDWEYQLDQWFAPGRDLHALDEAVAEAARRLGKPPRPRLVLLTIPYPNPTVRDFGAGLDGASLDLQDQDGVRKAAEWYVGEAVRRFASAGFRHLKLWGIYWMREEMPLSDEPRVRTVADVVHQAGLKFAWIPWWRASGFDRWRVPGFDVAFLQPNYAFHAWTHGGSVRRNRLAAAADLAAKHGLGIEMEAGDVVNSEADRLAFLHYLADGATGMLDYQRSAMAYYLGTETIERISTSNRPQDRLVYDSLARYIAGNRVPDPSPRLALNRTGDVLEARLSSQRRISALDILLDEPDRSAAWTGQVEVLVRKSRAESWRAGGWAIRSGYDETAGSRQVITVPIGQVASELRVVAHGQNGRPLVPARLVAETLERETPRSHAARGCAYVVSPRASGVYDDDGAKLTDGYVPERGFSEGRSVGWTSPSVAVSFDLGASRRFDRIEAVCQGGSYAAVNWPADAIAMISDDAPPPASLTGQG